MVSCIETPQPPNGMMAESMWRPLYRGWLHWRGSFCCPTNRLKPDAVPTIFNFSGYSAGDTDRPVKSDPGAALMRRERVQKRACQAEEREVNLASSTRETEKLVHSLFEDCLVCRLAPCSWSFLIHRQNNPLISEIINLQTPSVALFSHIHVHTQMARQLHVSWNERTLRQCGSPAAAPVYYFS